MRCKIVFIITVVLLFLAVQTVPLLATNKPKISQPIINPNNNDPGEDPGSGEEHPWQDNDDDTGFSKYGDGINNIISLIKQAFNGKKKSKVTSKKKYEKPIKSFSQKKFIKPDRKK
jgi:hypothetical protein